MSPWYDRSYKNRPIDLAREVGRIHRDLAYNDELSISRILVNPAPSSPPVIPDDDGEDSCCCDRVRYVSKDGSGDFDVIQEAFDYINAYEGPKPDSPWVVKACPGVYDESLTGYDNISLVGIGGKHTVIVNSLNAPALTTAGGTQIYENIHFTTTLDNAIHAGTATIVVAGSGGGGSLDEFNNCFIEMLPGSTWGMLVDCRAMDLAEEVYFKDIAIDYSSTEATVVGVVTHYGFYTGAGKVFINCMEGIILTVDVDDRIILYGLANVGYLHTINNTVELTDVAGGNVYVFFGIDAQTIAYSKDNYFSLYAGQSAYYIYDTAGVTVTSDHNKVNLAGAAGELSAYVNHASSNIKMHYDKFVHVNRPNPGFTNTLSASFEHIISHHPGAGRESNPPAAWGHMESSVPHRRSPAPPPLTPPHPFS